MNKIIKRTALVLGLIVIQWNTTYGQDSLKVSDDHLVKVQVNRLDRELSLSEKQKDKINHILLKRIDKVKKTHTDRQLNKNKMEKINEEYKLKLFSVLNDEQKQTFIRSRDNLKKQKKKRGKRR